MSPLCGNCDDERKKERWKIGKILLFDSNRRRLHNFSHLFCSFFFRNKETKIVYFSYFRDINCNSSVSVLELVLALDSSTRKTESIFRFNTMNSLPTYSTNGKCFLPNSFPFFRSTTDTTWLRAKTAKVFVETLSDFHRYVIRSHHLSTITVEGEYSLRKYLGYFSHLPDSLLWREFPFGIIVAESDCICGERIAMRRSNKRLR